MKGLKIIFATIFIITACVATAQNPAIAFKSGEKLTFVASYTAKLFPNTDMAEVTLTVSDSSRNGQPALLVRGNAKTRSAFNWFFEMNDTYATLMDATTLKPLVSTGEIREGSYKYSTRMTFDWNNKVVKTSYRNHKRPTASTKTMALPNNSFDAVSMFYNLRSTDVSKLVVGKSNVMQIVLEDTIRTISYKFLGRENRNFPKLGTFKTLKFSCQLVTSTGQSFEDGSEFYLWISDDNNRILLFLNSPIRVGSIQGRLVHYSGLKYPLTSKIGN